MYNVQWLLMQFMPKVRILSEPTDAAKQWEATTKANSLLQSAFTDWLHWLSLQ